MSAQGQNAQGLLMTEIIMSSDCIRNLPLSYYSHTSSAARRVRTNHTAVELPWESFSSWSRGNAWELDTFDKAPRNGGATTTSEFLKKPMLKKGSLTR
jgi:hypothetical protein